MTEPIVVSWSELDTYRQCPMKHYLAYNQRWTAPARAGSALDKGNMWHTVMEAWYKALKAKPGNLINALEAVGKVIDSFKDHGVDKELIDLIVWMHEGYVQRYGTDDEWEVIAVEHTMMQPLLFRGGVPSKFVLKAKIDLIVRDKARGLLRVIDHKSGTNLPTDKDLEFADQFGLYELLLNRAGMKVFNTVHSAARTRINKGDLIPKGHPEWKSTMKAQTLDERFARTQMKRTPAELAMIEAETIAAFQQAYSPSNAHQRHTDEERCKRRCSYTEACLGSRRSGDNTRLPQILEQTGFYQHFTRN